MIIEGHFAGTRAKHYTDRDIEQLREVCGKAYAIIKLGIDESSQQRAENQINNTKVAELEARLDRQRVLEAKLTILEDEMDRMKRLRKLHTGE